MLGNDSRRVVFAIGPCCGASYPCAVTEEDRVGSDDQLGSVGPVIIIFGMFAALGVVTAGIAFAVATQVEGDVRSLFKTVGLIASALAALTGYLAVAAWRRWWPFREPPLPPAAGSTMDGGDQVNC
jgi:hypothetical protein